MKIAVCAWKQENMYFAKSHLPFVWIRQKTVRTGRGKRPVYYGSFLDRFLPAYDKLRAMLRDGVIGEVKRITSQFGFTVEGDRRERKFKSELGGGALLDIGIYNLGFFI